VLAAPVNLFFDTTPIGRIVNRFSGDVSQVHIPCKRPGARDCLWQIDTQLPESLGQFLQYAFQLGVRVRAQPRLSGSTSTSFGSRSCQGSILVCCVAVPWWGGGGVLDLPSRSTDHGDGFRLAPALFPVFWLFGRVQNFFRVASRKVQ
jgi:hypothetical protein